MLRATIVLATGALAASCFACTPLPVAAPAPPSVAVSLAAIRAPSCQAAGIPTGHDFVAQKVRVMSLHPTAFPGALDRRFSAAASASGTPYDADLAAAVEDAPESFQEQLCQLDGVIVNTCRGGPDCSSADPRENSWGLRENKTRDPNRAGKYVAISAALWGPDGHAMRYPAFENSLLDGLLNAPWPTPTRPHYLDANDPANDPPATVLAALAHEYGHVLWYETMDPGRNNPGYDPNGFCPAIGGFFRESWTSGVSRPPQWRSFAGRGHTPGSSAEPDQRSPAVRKLLSEVAAGRWSAASSDLADIYEPFNSWASLFAAFSPDEDFVETFKLAVLRNAKAPLRDMRLQIPQARASFDVPGTLDGRSGLKLKLACFPIVP